MGYIDELPRVFQGGQQPDEAGGAGSHGHVLAATFAYTPGLGRAGGAQRPSSELSAPAGQLATGNWL